VDADDLNPYELEPADESLPAVPPPVPVRATGFTCVGCGYALDGLTADGVCPECGLAIRRSMAGEQLRHSGPAYVQSLARGAMLVLVSLIISAALVVFGVIFVIIAAVLAAGAGATTLGPKSVQLIIMMAGFLNSLIGLWGWWLLSSPDPRHGQAQQGSARRVLRVTIVMLVGTTLLSSIVQVFTTSATTPTMAMGTGVLSLVTGVISLVAWVTMFIAAMLYLKGLAARIPDDVVATRAQTYTWLLPLIYVLGSCIVVGPIAAMIMYALLINRVRVDLNRVLWEQSQLDGAV